MLLRRAQVDDPFVAEMLRQGLKRRLGQFDETLPSGETPNAAVARVVPLVNDPKPTLSRIPVEAPVINETPIPQRPLLTAGAVGPEVMPSSLNPVLERRLSSIVEPSPVMDAPPPPMVEGGERPLRRNTGDLERDEMDYYDQTYRYKPKNHNSRIAGAGATGLRGLRQGGLLGGLFGLVRGLIDKTADEKDAREENLARSGQVIGQGLQRRSALSDLANEQSMRDYRAAQMPYLLQRPELAADKQALEREKFVQKQAYDTWRMESGNRKADTYENWLEWKMKNGDMRANTYADYVEFQKDMGLRRQTETERHNQASEEIGRQNVGVRQEANIIRRETGGAGGNNSRDRDKAQRLINQARSYRVRAANAKTQEAADELNAAAAQLETDAITLYPDLVEEPDAEGLYGRMGGKQPVRMKPAGGASPSRALPKLTEQQIRDAAKARGLDPDEAIKRARARGQL